MRRSLPKYVLKIGKQVEILPMLTAVPGRSSRQFCGEMMGCLRLQGSCNLLALVQTQSASSGWGRHADGLIFFWQISTWISAVLRQYVGSASHKSIAGYNDHRWFPLLQSCACHPVHSHTAGGPFPNLHSVMMISTLSTKQWGTSENCSPKSQVLSAVSSRRRQSFEVPVAWHWV